MLRAHEIKRPHQSQQRAIAPVARAAVAALAAYAAVAPTARAALTTAANAPTSAAITMSLLPNRPGAKAALTITIRYAGGALGVPSPVRRSVLRFPAGLNVEIPSLASCAPARLRARGASGCPAQSQLGRGDAQVLVHMGSQRLTEHFALWAFLGPPRNLEPTFEILARGYTPLDETAVLTGTVLADRPPFGEDLVMPFPLFPTLMLEPDASVVRFSLTIGASHAGHAGHAGHTSRTPGASAVVVPSRCPAGGFPFAAEFAYADGSSSNARATSPCPR